MVYIGIYVFLKLFTIDWKLYNTIKCKMLRNFNILAGIGVSYMVDCRYIRWLLDKGYWRQSFVMFSVVLTCFLGSYETVYLCSVQFICIPVVMYLVTCLINNHSTKVHKNSYIWLARYTIPARGLPNPNTERTEFS